MRKQWVIGGSVAVIVAAMALAAVSRIKYNADHPDKKPEVTLEFAPSEVVKPQLVAMPERIEFSGALMAPRTAIEIGRAHV